MRRGVYPTVRQLQVNHDIFLYICYVSVCLFVCYLAAAADAGEDRRVAGSGAVLRIKRLVVGTAGMLHVLLYKHKHIQFRTGS